MPPKAIDYSKTVIYKIVCNDVNITDCYVGHTTDFTTRKYDHRHSCVNPNHRKHHFKIYQTIRANAGWSNWTMVIIEKFPCNNGEEARKRERYWYELLNAGLNMVRPLTTAIEKHEYTKRQNNNPYIREIKHNHYLANKAKHDVKNKAKQHCCCGSIVSHSNIPRHTKTEKHLNYIAKQTHVVST